MEIVFSSDIKNTHGVRDVFPSCFRNLKISRHRVASSILSLVQKNKLAIKIEVTLEHNLLAKSRFNSQEKYKIRRKPSEKTLNKD